MSEKVEFKSGVTGTKIPPVLFNPSTRLTGEISMEQIVRDALRTEPDYTEAAKVLETRAA